MSKHSSPHDWLNLVQLSGLLVSEPVLATAFPDGPERLPSHVYRRFGREWERYNTRPARSAYAGGNSSQSNKTSQVSNDQSRWIDFVLEDLLELRRAWWRKSNELPEGVSVSLLEYSQTLRPSRVLMSADGKPALLVSIVPPTQNLDKAETQTGRWKASPFTKLDRLLRETGVPLGLLTNGVEWRLVYAEKSLTTASITWTANEWSSEKTKLDAFYMLINAKRFRTQMNTDYTDKEKESVFIRENQRPILLLDLIKQSQARQIDVADQLGEQVRAAVEVFVRALDEADRSAGGAILAGMPLDRVYEMALSLMMRLVFVLYAEENGLLPHGEVLYDRAYGLTHLVYRLEQDRQSAAERLTQSFDGWPQLLATFRLIHAGCAHPDLNLLAYGGQLFDPARYPNAAGVPVLEHPQLRIDNAALYAVLRQLTFARARLGRETVQQRVSYRTLDIEQIGYVYQGLLDHKLARAGAEVRVKLSGPAEASVPLSELEKVGQEAILSYLAEKTDRKPETIGRWLAAIDADDVIELREQYGSDLADRLAPFAGVIATDGVIQPDRLYATPGESRRATGTHYTPQLLTEPIVRATLEPLLYRGPGPKPAHVVFGTGALIGPREILNLKVCDMTMGTAAFLVQADRYMAERLVEAWEMIEVGINSAHSPQPLAFITPYGEPTTDANAAIPLDRSDRLILARRLVAERCLYGVDKNPLAVEIARLSLWLATLAKDRPFTFLDHALKCGDSLVGADEDMFERWSHTDTSSTLPLFAGELRAQLAQALQARQTLQSFVVRDVRDAEEKTRLLHDADTALQRIKLGCDLIIGVRLMTAKPAEQTAQLLDLLGEYAATPTPDSALARKALAAARHEHAFHWPFEFPEVFLHDAQHAADSPVESRERRGHAGTRRGFDAFVGNPPFMRGKSISTNFGDNYLAYLKAKWNHARGSADYCTYFFLRSFANLHDAGIFGLLATNTISQGDTREVGLDYLLAQGGTIYSAEKNIPWPGLAAVAVDVVHLAKIIEYGDKRLNGRSVDRISSYLDSIDSSAKPNRLKQNLGGSHMGTNLVGVGFLVSKEEASQLIAAEHRNSEVLYPFLSGDDLNTRPDQSPSRWVINFHDWSLEKAKQYRRCMNIVQDRVYPERKTKPGNYSKLWWQFGRRQERLYEAIAPLTRVLVATQTSKYLAISFQPKGLIYDQTAIVIALDGGYDFATLSSNIHETWVKRYASTLETRLRYIPTDCFETFPFPQNPNAAQRAALERLGEQYHEHRRQIMLARQEGLTKTYNRFHDPAEHSADIAELRRLHVEMDQAVLAAYGWSEVQLDHEFRGAGKEARYSLSEGVKEELLRRLLELNFQIAAEEAESKKQDAQSAGGKTKKAGARGKAKKQSGGEDAPSTGQMGLW